LNKDRDAMEKGTSRLRKKLLFTLRTLKISFFCHFLSFLEDMVNEALKGGPIIKTN
jgi:hypothetical protein